MVRKMLDASPRVRISTFGFGADHDSAMLRALAEAGSGIYYYLESAERIPIAFADALGGLLAVTCQNAELRFTPAKGVTLKKVHTRFPTKQAPGNSTVVSLGDLLAEEVKDILFDVDMPECGVTETFEVGALELTYLDVESVKTVTVSQRCSVGRVAEVAPGREGNVDVAGHRARWEATEAMEEAERLADAGKMDEARAGLENVRAKVNQMSLRAGRMKSPISPMLAALETDLNEATQRAKDRVTWQGKGKNWFSSKANEHRFQRSAALNDDFDVEDELEGIGEADAYNKKSAPAAFTYANRKQRAMKSAAAAALRR